jgi:hypothetical protein
MTRLLEGAVDSRALKDHAFAERALLALGGRTCAQCGHQVFPPREHGDKGENCCCPKCGRAFCPFCCSTWTEECDHLLAAEFPEDDTWIGPLEQFDLPWVEPDGWEYREPSPELEAIFGEMVPLLEAYQQGLNFWPHRLTWLGNAFPLLKTPIVSVYWVGNWMGADAAYCYFAPDPNTACAELAELATRFESAFQRLAPMIEEFRASDGR